MGNMPDPPKGVDGEAVVGLTAANIDEALSAGLGMPVMATAYPFQPARSAVRAIATLYLLCCAVMLWVGLSRHSLAIRVLFSMPLLLGAGFGAARRVKHLRVKATCDGLLIAPAGRPWGFQPWAALQELHVDTGAYSNRLLPCYRLVLSDEILYLPYGPAAERIVAAAKLVLRAKRLGHLVPGSDRLPPLVSESSLSAPAPGAPLAGGSARAISPAGPPDQLTESEDA